MQLLAAVLKPACVHIMADCAVLHLCMQLPEAPVVCPAGTGNATSTSTQRCSSTGHGRSCVALFTCMATSPPSSTGEPSSRPCVTAADTTPTS